jgi:hypothetical protein
MDYENNSEESRFDLPTQNQSEQSQTEQSQTEQNQTEQSQSEPYQYQPQYEPDSAGKGKKKHLGLAIASLVLSGISVLCCWVYAIGIVPALIGTIFGLIALIGGKDKSVRIMGGIGLGLGILGIILNVFMIVTLFMMIDWSSVTAENIRSIQNIDPENQQEVMKWIQQFFKVDISKYYIATQ